MCRVRTGAYIGSGTRPVLSALVLVAIVSAAILFPASPSIGEEERAIPDVIINEVLYDPESDDVDGEFVEILNIGGGVVDLHGWAITDNDGLGEDVILPSIALHTGARVVIWSRTGTDDTDASDGLAEVHIGADQGIWTNTGDDVSLIDDGGGLVDFVSYGDGTYVDDAPPGIDWDGPLGFVPEGYSFSRLPDGKWTGLAADLGPGVPTPGLANKEDGPPDVSYVACAPEEPDAYEDVVVHATVTDEVAVRGVSLGIDHGAGHVDIIEMVPVGGGCYTATVTGLPGGSTVWVRVTATDPAGNTNTSPPIELRFRSDEFVRLIIDVDGPPEVATPGQILTVSGQALWSNGSAGVGNATVTIARTMGRWTDAFEGYFSVRFEAPLEEGTYDVDLLVEVGDEAWEEGFTVESRWPHEALTLEATTSDDMYKTRGTVVITGEARFSDGVSASAAPVIIRIPSLEGEWNVTTENDGTFRMTLEAPSMSGSYVIEVSTASLGRSATFEMQLNVTDHLTVGLDGVPAGIISPGEGFTIEGRVSHHDNTSAMDTLVIVEVLNTTQKVRCWTDANGRYQAMVEAPGHPGAFILRITAVSGDTVTSRHKVITVEKAKGDGGDQGLPGWSAVTAALAVVAVAAALAGWRRRRRHHG